ncbi:MAG: putative porin [Marinifilaceae bacterium]|jgi:hypothetical protein|nr:putative porin [Marinifilaceae bacterium]
MRRLVVILIVNLLSLCAIGQVNNEDLLRNLNGNNSNQSASGMPHSGHGHDDKMSKEDSLRALIKPVYKLYKWKHSGVYSLKFERDSSIDRFHILNIANLKSISNASVGTLIGPSISNILMDRNYNTDYLFFRPYDYYLTKSINHLDVNTTTPFTDFKFISGGSKTTGETIFSIKHTQNINPFWNIGIEYNYQNDEGSYMNQAAQIYDFNAFTSYQKERLGFSFFITNNRGKFENNGGIKREFWIRDTSVSAENIPVNHMKARTEMYSKELKAFLQYRIGKAKEMIKGKDTTNVYPTKVVYSFRQEENYRSFKEESIPANFFANNYISDTKTYDETDYLQNTHKLKFVLNTDYKTIRPGVYGGIDYTEKRYCYFKEASALKAKYLKDFTWFRTTYIEGGVFKQDSGKIQYDFNTKIGILGDYKSEKEFHADITYNIDSLNHFNINSKYTDKVAEFNYTHFFSNHIKWDNDFKNIKTFSTSLSYKNDKFNIEIGGNILKHKNYIYFDENIQPRQIDEMTTLTAFIKHNFEFYNFHLLNTLYYQNTNQDIGIPKYSYYGSLYYKNTLFKKHLLFMVGTDIRMNSKFFAPKYDMVTGAFYQQSDKEYGNYPKMDFFINLKIKRTIIFCKYEHISSFFKNTNYFISEKRPMDPGMFKFGFRWIFND